MRHRIGVANGSSVDACCPNSGQLADGTVLTTWYSNLFGKFYIALLRYRPEDI